MKISMDIKQLRHDYLNTEEINYDKDSMVPKASGNLERMGLVVKSDDSFTSTAFFAIVAVDEVGNRGPLSNVIPITVGISSQYEGIFGYFRDNKNSYIRVRSELKLTLSFMSMAHYFFRIIEFCCHGTSLYGKTGILGISGALAIELS